MQQGRRACVLQCGACQLVFVRPLPSSEEHRRFHGEAYFRRFYEEGIEEFYTRQGSLFQRERQVKARRLQLVESLATKGRLLDVGTGQGLFPILARESGWEAWAVDISAYLCAYLSQRGIRVRRGYLEEVSLPEGYFDAVTLWHCLEHTFNPLTTLQTVRRTLKRGGALLVEVPRLTAGEMWARKLLRKPLFELDLDEWHFYHFTPNTLSRLATQAGLEVVRVGHQPLWRKTLRGWVVEGARSLISSARLVDLRSTVFLVARRGEER